jgi:hypothetical protein
MLKNKIKTHLRNNFINKKFCQSEDLNRIKNISEFKQGLIFINEGKFDQAEVHFSECLKIFKNINQTESFSYIYIMKKYTQSLFYQKKLEECEKALKASIELSKIVFQQKEELTFPYYRNLLAFYTYTDIQKASVLIDNLNLETSEDSKQKKYFFFAAGAIKMLNNEYNSARSYMNKTMAIGDIPVEFQAYNMHNYALLNCEMKKDCDMVETEEARTKWKKEFNFADGDIAEKESILLYKQALAKLELEHFKGTRSDAEVKLLSQFLYSQNEILENPNQDEELLSNSFKSNLSGLTMTNLSEIFFEKGKEKELQTAFWLKAGIKHYENYEKENIARHLIIFALFYSQLGQTMFAEGLYRKSIELLKNVKFF